MTDRTPYTADISQVAGCYNLPFALLEAQVIHESSADPFAFRYEHAYFDRYIYNRPDVKGYKYGPLAACSYGLLQIMLETAIELGFTGQPQDLFVPRVGLNWGAKKMQELVAWSKGDYKSALAAYNGGTVGNTIAPLRNQAYVDAVYQLVGSGGAA